MNRRTEKFALRVVKGGFQPADQSTVSRLRDRNLSTGDLVFAEFKKPRNPKFHRLAHQLGSLVAENIEQFEGMPAHRVLKRIQIEANVGCEEMAIYIPGLGQCMHLTPLSLGFESMDQGEFYEVLQGFCRHISKTYWPTLKPGQIEEMAGVMVGD